MKLSKILLGSAFAGLLLSSVASAEPKSADEFYKEGDTQYNLGNFDKAVDAFKQGFALETQDSKKPAYLYNIAQSYRQAQNCQQALFFYKRFLALKATDTVKPLKPQLKADVEARIAELEDCVKTQDSIRNKAPTDNMTPDDGRAKGNTGKPDPVKADPIKPPVKTDPVRTDQVGGHDANAADAHDGHKGDATKHTADAGNGEGEGEGEDGEAERVHRRVAAPAPHLISARLMVGGSKIGMGNLPVPVRGTVGLTAGYPLQLAPQLSLDLGAAFTLTPLSYENSATGGTSSASLTSIGVDVGATYAVAPKIGVRGDLGLGALMFGGLVMGNPFTVGGAPASAALGMFNVRLGLSAEYEVIPNLVVVATPFAFSYSPAKTGLTSDISALTRIDFLLGVGYRM